MKSTRLVAFSALLIGAGLSSLAGCDDTTENTGGAGGSGTSSSTGKTTGSMVTVSSSSGGPTGNHSFETAEDIELNGGANTAGTLVDTATKNFYKFTGTKGQRITIVANAQGLAEADGDDNTVTDTFVTIYDSNKVAIAQNDDAWPRFGRDSQAFVVLPTDGTYYFSIEDCNSAIPSGCATATDVVTFDYETFVAETKNLNATEFNEGTAANDTAAEAVGISYKVPSGGMVGQYGTILFNGGLSAASDTDFFTFTPPLDADIEAGQRPEAAIWVQPISANNGDGSTANVIVTVLDSTNTVIAQVDQKNYLDGDSADNEPIAMSVPVTLGEKYYVRVTASGAASSPATDYYFASNFVGTFLYGKLETADVTNGVAATAEAVASPMGVTSGSVYVDGDIASGLDVDFYSVTVPAGNTKASLFCDAQRAGSGLRGATFGLYGTDGTTKLGEYTENPAKNLGLFGPTQVTLTGNPAKILLKVTAPTQDATVTGTFYRCGVAFAP